MSGFELSVWAGRSVQHQVVTLLPGGAADWPAFETALRCAIIKTPKLRDAIARDPNAALLAVVKCAQLGLSLNPADEHYDLIPYKGVVQGQVRARGLQFLALQSGMVIDMGVEVVYRQEQYRGELLPNGRPDHRLHVFERDAYADSDIVGAYAFALVAGQPRYQVRFLGIERIQRLRAMSQAPEGPAWTQHFPAMCCAKALKALLRTGMVPLRPGLRVSDLDETEDKAAGAAMTAAPAEPPSEAGRVVLAAGRPSVTTFEDEAAKHVYEALDQDPLPSDDRAEEVAQGALYAMMQADGMSAAELDTMCRKLFKKGVEIQEMTVGQANACIDEIRRLRRGGQE